MKCHEKNLKPIMPFIPFAFAADVALPSDPNPKKKPHAPKSLVAFFAPIKTE